MPTASAVVLGLVFGPADLMRRVHDGEPTENSAPLEKTQINILVDAFVQILRNSFLQHREGLVSEAAR